MDKRKKFTPSRKKIILECLRKNLPVTLTCNKAGISTKTFYRWRERGKLGEKGFDKFLEDCEYASTVGAEAAMDCIIEVSWISNRGELSRWNSGQLTKGDFVEPMQGAKRIYWKGPGFGFMASVRGFTKNLSRYVSRIPRNLRRQCRIWGNGIDDWWGFDITNQERISQS